MLQGNGLLQLGYVTKVKNELVFAQRNVQRIQQSLLAHQQERVILQDMLEDNLEVFVNENIEFETILAPDRLMVLAVENRDLKLGARERNDAVFAQQNYEHMQLLLVANQAERTILKRMLEGNMKMYRENSYPEPRGQPMQQKQQQ